MNPNPLQAAAAAATSGFAGRRVLVVGDAMLDRYLFARADRMSAEAPLPIFEVVASDSRPGGAANVAANLASLGGEVRLVGLVGADADGERLRELLAGLGVDTGCLETDPSRPTTTKSRIVAQNKQVVRFDHEVRGELEEEHARRLGAAVEELAGWAEVCVISDYAKGVVSHDLGRSLLAAAARHGRGVVVDPKGPDFAKYAGADVLTPNLAEAVLAARRHEPPRTDDQVLALGWELMSSCGVGAMLITRGADGMSLVTGERCCRHIPTRSQEVYDVTGAGDTVVAVMALGLAAGHSLELSANLANHAAGVVVSKLGTAVVSAAELVDSHAGMTADD